LAEGCISRHARSRDRRRSRTRRGLGAGDSHLSGRAGRRRNGTAGRGTDRRPNTQAKLRAREQRRVALGAIRGNRGGELRSEGDDHEARCGVAARAHRSSSQLNGAGRGHASSRTSEIAGRLAPCGVHQHRSHEPSAHGRTAPVRHCGRAPPGATMDAPSWVRHVRGLLRGVGPDRRHRCQRTRASAIRSEGGSEDRRALVEHPSAERLDHHGRSCRGRPTAARRARVPLRRTPRA
jgi:hypothetical protein